MSSTSFRSRLLALMCLGFVALAGGGACAASSPEASGKIAFVSSRDGNNPEIYVMNADGTDQTRLTNDEANDANPTFSPDGTKIAFTRDMDSEVYVMNADGTGRTRLTNHPELDHDPAFSPDGTKIAFSSDRDGNKEVYVMNTDGTDRTNLTDSEARDAEPAWSPDGKKIAFKSQPASARST